LAEDDLELYAFRRLGSGDVDRVEDHLLVCGACRRTLDEIVAFRRAILTELERAAGDKVRFNLEFPEDTGPYASYLEPDTLDPLTSLIN
jgi:hypothetical protein